MTLIRWVVIAVVLACLIAVFLIVWSYRRELEDVRADRDEDAQKLADLTADMAQNKALLLDTRTRLLQLAQHVTANETPSTGRHAHSEARAA